MKAKESTTQRKAKITIPSKTSTNVSLSALTLAFFLLDLISSNSKSSLKKIFQKNDVGEFVLAREEYYNQDGVFEKVIFFLNNKRFIYCTAETYEKLKKYNQKKRGVKFYSESEKLLEEIGYESERLEDVYKPMFQSAFERASEILFWATFLERFFKLDTAQSVINFCYTLVRSIDYLSDFKVLKKDFIKLGNNWRWRIAWELALQDEKVKAFWEGKQAIGEKYLKDWKSGCEKQATSRWSERKYHIEGIKEVSLEMRNKLKTKFDSL